jgi:protocatechuate 3,4-dioxygenase beta subunit
MKNTDNRFSSRRRFFKQAAAAGAGSLLLNVPGVFAEQLVVTPEQTEGPYYPPDLPLDTDNDLLVINNNLTSAVGQITYISGRILNPNGDPVRNAYMEIWHADNSGAYIHPSSMGYATRDQNFQGFGRFLTASSGEYLFRTIKPGLYTGRTRHIHFKVKVSGQPTLTSQLYFLGEAQNSGDSVLQGVRDAAQRNSVVVPFVPIEGSTVGALAAKFDIVLSVTPGSIPVLTITNISDPVKTGFGPGDSWRVDLTDAPAGAPVRLHLWKDNVDFGISGPYGDLTDNTGSWSFTGSYGSGDVGLWQVQAVVGSATSAETSTPATIRVSNGGV